MKLNSDGAVVQLGNKAATGGVLRDDSGSFIRGFASHIGPAAITEAELRGLQMGLKIALAHGVPKLIIESDSLSAVQLLKMGCSPLHPYHSIVHDIQMDLQRLRACYVTHVLREANQVADDFAKFGLSLDMCSRIFWRLPSFASLPVQADLTGTLFPRGF